MNVLKANGSAAVPPRVMLHLVAARYGTTVAAVRDWPADDYFDAVNLLGVTGGR